MYCYKIMPFVLKNARATYQRTIHKVIEEQLGRNIEVYVNDMIVMSKRTTYHVANLAETLHTLRHHSMNLNPKKFVFGVEEGKCKAPVRPSRPYQKSPVSS